MSVTPSVTGSSLKFLVGWVLSFMLRLIPFRPPNIEPILAVQTPFTKQYGFIIGFLFAFINIALFDFITGKMGVWTIITAACYGFLALFSAWYFKRRPATSVHFAIHALYATLIYDAITGLTIGPLFFGQSFQEALIGQIPFTAYHLIGNITLSALISPVIYRLVITNPRFEVAYLKRLLLRPNLDV
jgi:uncharacterized membrane protein